MSGEALGELFVHLKIKSDDFNKGLNTAGDKLNKFGKGISSTGKTLTKFGTTAIVGAGAGLFAIAKQAGNTADKLLDLQSVTGLHTDTLQEWKYIASAAGVEFEGFVGSISKFESKIPQIEKGTGPAAEAMEALGLSLYDSQGNIRDMNDLFPEMVQALQGVENPVKRNALATQLFGRDLDNLAPILSMTTDQVADLSQEAHDMGAIRSEESLKNANAFRESIDKLQTSLGTMGMELGTAFIPLLNEFVPVIQDSIIPAIRSMTPIIKTVADIFKDLPGPVKVGAVALAGIAAAVGPILMVLGPAIAGIGSLATAIGAAGGLSAVLGGAAALLTGTLLPALVAVLPIIALVAGAYLIFKNWDKIKEYVMGAVNKVKKFLSSVDLKATGKAIMRSMVDGFKFLVLAPYKVMFKAVNGVVEAVTGVNLYDSGKAMIMAFVDGIKAVINKPYETMEAGMEKLGRLFPHSPAKEGPFKQLPNWSAVFDGIEDVDTQRMGRKAVSGMSAEITGKNAASTNNYSDNYEIKIGTVNNQQDINKLVDEIARINKQKRMRRGITA